MGNKLLTLSLSAGTRRASAQLIFTGSPVRVPSSSARASRDATSHPPRLTASASPIRLQSSREHPSRSSRHRPSFPSWGFASRGSEPSRPRNILKGPKIRQAVLRAAARARGARLAFAVRRVWRSLLARGAAGRRRRRECDQCIELHFGSFLDDSAKSKHVEEVTPRRTPPCRGAACPPSP